MLSKYENSGPVDCSLPFDLNGIRGKSVLITGGLNKARSGLGYEYAKTFANAGAIVTNADIKPSSDELTLPGVRFIKCDVRSWDEQKEAFDAAIASSANGCIDVIIANAGISGDDPLLRGIDELEIKKPDTTLVEINLLGAMYTARLALHHFSVEWPADSAQQDKCLILKSSIMGYLDSRPSYGSTKFGVRAIMRALRHLGRCRVNVVAPWFIATPIMDENVVKTLGSQLAAQGSEFAHSDDSVNCISRIASDKSIHGRGFAIVPRSLVKEGYMDVDEDDFEEGTLCYKLQHITYGLSHRK
ncbi:uncharacterized protein N7479_010077 [Penicillium vulpinum]|uniref:NAD(P)-binding protein n=1 Tax=Penicillium vulpinum TaxID=29845 RepID=A0A1V6RVM1_9EURO|nr:uncharacterized protein N7479_010077 [Penicillium vulpinum]KAJ5951664.1 hypothetical protein N7479_010077 [Penicillium vulpinum]OQE05549.1 hypothetical protein PENVUL_c023G01096 [Penicillium vulpinum]